MVTDAHASPAARTRWYSSLYVQVLLAIAIGVLLGHYLPETATQFKPLGDGFIKLIKMMIAPIIFCTIVLGIGSVRKAATVGKVGGLAFIYFLIMSTFALAIGLVVGNLLHPGTGMNLTETAAGKGAELAETAHEAGGLMDFVQGIIPDTLFSSLTAGSVLQALFVALLVGFALQAMGSTGEPILRAVESLQKLVFKILVMILWLAPIGAFGRYLAREYLLIVSTSSSESALPRLIAKMEHLGVDRSTVGVVVPTGYSFNLDGTAIYLTMASLFIAGAMGDPLSLPEQIGLLVFMIVASKGAAGVTGAGLATLAGGLQSHRPDLLDGVGLIVGIDRFMSEARALTNFSGNAVATILVGSWTKTIDNDRVNTVLRGDDPFDELTMVDDDHGLRAAEPAQKVPAPA
jgi:aerobic C4-dicarboxylate transport protein